jgi:hypothetical protein
MQIFDLHAYVPTVNSKRERGHALARGCVGPWAAGGMRVHGAVMLGTRVRSVGRLVQSVSPLVGPGERTEVHHLYI